ncbi:thiamine pyrophosphate-dependent dehydrogenase E1 component subunit alpha [Dechloromonas sp. XY25]|uniref:Thiamine pyrophosphate-dependent dehydrogenase E1 component subunit alpha n=1 Tax=Dechloromonas hankyongensis TaxID=2908002 RepID=A0ABS9JXM4_9RHOO|nr:thiamine pyrophosphate-dependent dehydrogenase E1 component subunit alpha [Dechloromonas hankyongensis]MCG2575670.1 thiamine pyrophosphate-dependent dehydrogenase E1 component subunit alpha [Dechloromonas hankyongensis]
MPQTPHPNDLTGLYAQMLLVRTYENAIVAGSTAGKVPGTCTSVGQEAAAVGIVNALSGDDLILTNHRSAGHLLARGADPGRLLAEVMGRSDGYCQGMSGSLHISVKELGVVLTSTIVGAELSMATGVALAQQMQGQLGIVACFFGDGAACEGSFHESLNLASLWNLPILYVCENNHWQAFVHRREANSRDHVADWAASYRIPAATVDGNDVSAVLAAARQARETIRETGRPYLLETLTYRTRGHFEPDDQAYVDPAERNAWLARDPITLCRQQLIDSGRLTVATADALAARVEDRIATALAFAENSPYPQPEQMLRHIYA